ncbi:MAG: SIS domain-containing protein [Armatimonadota bacterium]
MSEILMLDEIREQPAAFSRVLELEWSTAQEIAREVRRRDIRFVVIAARGSSDNAAAFGKYLLEIENGLPVSLAAPSVMGLYGARMRLEQCLVIGISQSGEALDVTEVLAGSREMGATTVAITNTEGSAMAQAAEHVMLCRAGEERSVAATKTYLNSLGALYLLSAALGGRTPGLFDLVRSLPNRLDRVLAMEEQIRSRVERYRYMDECVVISRGLNLATAYEIALKLTETCYLVAEPYSSSDFMHGPIAMVENGFPCFLFAPEGVCLSGMVELARQLRDRQAEVVVFSESRDVLDCAVTRFSMPDGTPELLSPPVYAVAGQLFACWLSVTRGLNPDAPRGLRKVTRTR